MHRDACIFISYRRQDSQGFAGRVTDDLIDNFGAARMFRDDDIPEGSDFTSVLEQALARCSVMIVVIGPNWLKVQDDELPRLFNPDDWVRREIESALQRGIWILPILVGNAAMPSTSQLPDTLQPIAKIQAMCMADRTWERDLARLVTLLLRRIPALSRESNATQSQQEEIIQSRTSSFQDFLARLAQMISHRQSVRRTRTRPLYRGLRNLLARILWSGAALLVGWYVFENHATSEQRKEVADFLAFTQSKFSYLFDWLW